MRMNIVNFFDPHNVEHLKAYKELTETGRWPKDFWEEIKDFEFLSTWHNSLFYKLADAWIEHKLGK